MSIRRPDFPLPDLTDERTEPFFAAAARHVLRLPRCEGCGALVWYPADACGRCGGEDLAWTRVSGRGRLFTWAVVRRAFLPAFEDRVPFVTGLVALEEDPAARIVTLVVDAAADGLAADLPMEAVFRPLRFSTVPDREVVVPMFRPAPSPLR